MSIWSKTKIVFSSIGTYLEPFIKSFMKKEALAALALAKVIVPQIAAMMLDADGATKGKAAKIAILKGLAAQGITSIKKSTLDNAIQVAGELTDSFSKTPISTKTE